MPEINLRSGREHWNGEYKDSTGTLFHYVNGRLHREDGPAVIRLDGSKRWFFNSRWVGCYEAYSNRYFITLDSKEIEVFPSSEEEFQKKINLLMIFQ